MISGREQILTANERESWESEGDQILTANGRECTQGHKSANLGGVKEIRFLTANGRECARILGWVGFGNFKGTQIDSRVFAFIRG